MGGSDNRNGARHPLPCRASPPQRQGCPGKVFRLHTGLRRTRMRLHFPTFWTPTGAPLSACAPVERRNGHGSYLSGIAMQRPKTRPGCTKTFPGQPCRKGEIGCRRWFRQLSTLQDKASRLRLPISPFRGWPTGQRRVPGNGPVQLFRRPVGSQCDESLGAVYSTKTFTLAARPAASITVRVE
jgi:hypothetical protein